MWKDATNDDGEKFWATFHCFNVQEGERKKNVKSIFYSYCLCASFKRDEIFIILKKFIFHPRVQRGTEAESRRESYD